MNDLATLLAQLGNRAEPAADPALAAVRLARASLDALVLKLGQNIDAKVTAQLVAGLTQLTAGSENFVLKLETPIPVGTRVSVKVTPSPTGQPTVTVTPQPAAVAAPLAVSTPPAAMPIDRPQPTPAVAPQTAPTAPAASQPAPTAGAPISPSTPPAADPMPTAPAPSPAAIAVPATGAAPATPAAPVTPAPVPATPVSPAQQSVATIPAPALALPPQPTSAPPTTPQLSTATAPASPPPVAAPAAPTSVPSPVVTAPAAVAAPPVATPTQQATASYGSPAAQPPATLPVAQSSLSPAPTVLPSPSVTPLPTTPVAKPPVSPQSAPQPIPTPTATEAPATPRAAPMPLQQVLADPVQAAARQTTVAPLLAQAAAILAAPASAALPLPMLEAIARVLATRVDLNRAPPDGKALRQAVLQAGTLDSGPRQPDDMRSTLLALRSTLAAFLGSKVEAVAPIIHRPPPPMAGEPARAPQSAPAAPIPDLSPEETAKQLLGHTDGALARTKLLQLASNPPDLRAPNPANGPDLRFEIPMLLGAETGILQLLVHRDGRHKPDPRERGWRMRFAMSFSTIGEVGADVALFGRAANVSIWAVEPATADALEAMLPELAPALASHGLDVAGLRVRRGPPPRRPQAPGRLLDSAR